MHSGTRARRSELARTAYTELALRERWSMDGRPAHGRSARRFSVAGKGLINTVHPARRVARRARRLLLLTAPRGRAVRFDLR